MTKKYKWNYEKLLIFIIGIMNICIGVYFVLNVYLDNYFIQNYVSASLEISYSFKLVIAIIIILLLIYLNFRFYYRDLFAKKIVVIFQLLAFIAILKAFFTTIIYYGFFQLENVFLIFSIILMSTLIYLTNFSLTINKHFEKSWESY